MYPTNASEALELIQEKTAVINGINREFLQTASPELQRDLSLLGGQGRSLVDFRADILGGHAFRALYNQRGNSFIDDMLMLKFHSEQVMLHLQDAYIGAMIYFVNSNEMTIPNKTVYIKSIAPIIQSVARSGIYSDSDVFKRARDQTNRLLEQWKNDVLDRPLSEMRNISLDKPERFEDYDPILREMFLRDMELCAIIAAAGLRSYLASQTSGKTIDVGTGKGWQLPYLGAAGIENIIALDTFYDRSVRSMVQAVGERYGNFIRTPQIDYLKINDPHDSAVCFLDFFKKPKEIVRKMAKDAKNALAVIVIEDLTPFNILRMGVRGKLRGELEVLGRDSCFVVSML